jgi:hypothetical protein
MRLFVVSFLCRRLDYVYRCRASSLMSYFPWHFRIAGSDETIMIFKASDRLTREQRGSQVSFAVFSSIRSLMTRNAGRKR